jgi:hypothetical protein
VAGKPVLSLYSCPHIVVHHDSNSDDEDTSDLNCGYNTGAIVRFENDDATQYQVVTFLSRIDEEDF